jgi:hypothetical protein
MNADLGRSRSTKKALKNLWDVLVGKGEVEDIFECVDVEGRNMRNES